jgi:chromosome segregation ATPase
MSDDNIIPFRAKTPVANSSTVTTSVEEGASAEVIQIYVNIESDEFKAEVCEEDDLSSEFMFSQTAPTEKQQRLANSLANLSAALAEQKIALAQWKESLAGLKSTMSGLGDSYQKLHDNLSGVKTDLDTARDTSLNTIKLLDDSGLTKPE